MKKLRVSLETSFFSYLTGHQTSDRVIATAAVHSVDYLLTWNCRHMANPHTLPLTREIVEMAGYRCPAIITPSGFMELTERGGDQ